MKQTIKVEHTVNVDDCVTLGTILASHLLEKKGIVAEEGKENTLFPHWSKFDSDDTQSKLRVSSEVSYESFLEFNHAFKASKGFDGG